MTAPGSSETHLQRLAKRYANGRTIKHLERESGLKEGALGNYLRPAKRDPGSKIPSAEVMIRFAAAFGAPLEEVSQAFIQDWVNESGIPVGPGDAACTADEAELLENYRALDARDKLRLHEIMGVLRRTAEKPSPSNG
jgi:transcriptional regulator with XRE-family HTH domain